MNALGFNIQKGEIWCCEMSGDRANPVFVDLERQRFQPTVPRAELMNAFKQIFSELLARRPADRIGYRLSLDAKTSEQVAYLGFSYGVLNLVAYERGASTQEFTSQAFTKKALNYANGDKFAACDARIAGRPTKWGNAEKLAALAAWMALDE